MKQKGLRMQEEAMRCLLCKDAPCSKVCKNGDPARAVRAIRFGNEKWAGQWIAKCSAEELEAAEKACIHYDRPIRIREIAQTLCCDSASTNNAMPSLAIDFCGIHCENPFFLASSAICTNYEMVARAFDMGWAGVFYKTICLQDIREVSPRFDAVHDSGGHGNFFAFRNMEQLSENPVDVDFDILKRLKQNYPTKVVIASVMGQHEEDWIKLAKMAEEAGCDAVELNYSCPQMRQTGMGSDVGQDPELVTFFTAYVKRSVKIPVIPKMTPNIAHISEPAMGAYFAGADAISAINTIKSVTLGEGSEVNGCQTGSGLSGRAVKPIALRHILAMVKNPIMKNIQYSGIGGIETWRDALEFIQLGCNNVQVCTAVMQYGYRIIDDMILGLQNYMAERGIAKVDDLVGELLPKFLLPSDLDRDTIVYPKIDRETCIGCGRCFTSCMDGGHQAIAFDDETRQPRIVGTKCVGCHLCRLVCPTGAIGLTKRIPKKTEPTNLNSKIRMKTRDYIRLLAVALICGMTAVSCCKKSAQAAPEEDASQFVTLTDVVPDAILEIRYFGTYNFVGTRIDGYEEPTALMTRIAADSLRAVSDDVKALGYRLKIYDAYRPQKGVDNFVRWAENVPDTLMKTYFYPDLDKSVLFEQDYIYEKSGHTRGSTVDLTLFDMNTEKEVDMGGTFDWFGPESHPDFCGNPETGEYTGDNSKSPQGRSITPEQFRNRMILRQAMLRHGFKALDSEWWHFTLKDEPFPDTYFTFPVKAIR